MTYSLPESVSHGGGYKRREGRMSSKEKTKMKQIGITTYINSMTYEEIRKLAMLDARSVSSLVKIAVQEYIKNNEKKLKRAILKEIKAKSRI